MLVGIERDMCLGALYTSDIKSKSSALSNQDALNSKRSIVSQADIANNCFEGIMEIACRTKLRK